jgi:hypothetical protein
LLKIPGLIGDPVSHGASWRPSIESALPSAEAAGQQIEHHDRNEGLQQQGDEERTAVAVVTVTGMAAAVTVVTVTGMAAAVTVMCDGRLLCGWVGGDLTGM